MAEKRTVFGEKITPEMPGFSWKQLLIVAVGTPILMLVLGYISSLLNLSVGSDVSHSLLGGISGGVSAYVAAKFFAEE